MCNNRKMHVAKFVFVLLLKLCQTIKLQSDSVSVKNSSVSTAGISSDAITSHHGQDTLNVSYIFNKLMNPVNGKIQKDVNSTDLCNGFPMLPSVNFDMDDYVNLKEKDKHKDRKSSKDVASSFNTFFVIAIENLSSYKLKNRQWIAHGSCNSSHLVFNETKDYKYQRITYELLMFRHIDFHLEHSNELNYGFCGRVTWNIERANLFKV